MKILGIDTSSKILSITLCENDNIIIERSYDLGRQHSSFMIPKIKEMLENAKYSIDDVDGFVVGLGPGSFTGLRVGVSAVKGFGVATDKPCIGVASMDAMALEVEQELIIPIIDAKRNQVYSAIYEKTKSGLKKKSDYLLLPIEKLIKKIKGEAVFLGDGITLYKDIIEKLNKKAKFLEEKYWYPKASNLIKLALPKIKKQKRSNTEKLEPLYIYPKDCQIRKKKQ